MPKYNKYSPHIFVHIYFSQNLILHVWCTILKTRTVAQNGCEKLDYFSLNNIPEIQKSFADIRGWGEGHGRTPPLGPISFILMRFSEKKWPINRLAPHLGVATSRREILDPPLRTETKRKVTVLDVAI